MYGRRALLATLGAALAGCGSPTTDAGSDASDRTPRATTTPTAAWNC